MNKSIVCLSLLIITLIASYSFYRISPISSRLEQAGNSPTSTSEENALVRKEVASKAIAAPIPEIMIRIAYCESHNKQFSASGTVFRGKINPKDIGRFQINEKFHLAEAKSLGVDIYTWQGNTDFAMWLYHKEGTTPWNWSKSCWGK